MTDNQFATEEKVKQFGNLENVSSATLLTVHFAGARRDVLDIIDEEKYDAIFAAKLETVGDYSTADYENLEEAECKFVLARAVGPLNVSSSGNGMTRATGYGDGRQENLSFDEIQKLKDMYTEEAMKILKRYIAVPDADEDDNDDYVVTSNITMIAI